MEQKKKLYAWSRAFGEAVFNGLKDSLAAGKNAERADLILIIRMDTTLTKHQARSPQASARLFKRLTIDVAVAN